MSSWQWAGKIDELTELAAELVRTKVNVSFAPSSTCVQAARQVTTTIPIVFAVHADPVGTPHRFSAAVRQVRILVPYCGHRLLDCGARRCGR
jgi:hypothetical protein